jgi:hypothetical protein
MEPSLKVEESEMGPAEFSLGRKIPFNMSGSSSDGYGAL